MSHGTGGSWRLPRVEPATVRAVAARHRIDLLMATVLVRRGIAEPAAVEDFLGRKPASREVRDSGSTELIAGMPAAAERIGCCGGQHVFVFGDPDVDGIAAAAIMVELARRLGALVRWRIPAGGHHGLREADLDAARESGAELLVCVDCSVGAVEAAAAERAGIDVLVVDHHQPLDQLPAGLIVLNPEYAGGGDRTDSLAAGAVALQLAEAVQAGGWLVDSTYSFPYDLAALSTLADRMPLTGENRRITARGIAMMAQTARPGLLDLWNQVGRSQDPTAKGAVQLLNPVLGAAGRFGEGDSAVALLVSRDRAECATLADRLMELNARRRSETATAWHRMLPQARWLLREYADARCLVVDDPKLVRGLAGPLAFRLSRFLGMAVAVIACDGECISGSIRSPDGDPDVLQLLSEADGLLTRCGGHRNAGGFVAPVEVLAALRRRWSDPGVKTGTAAEVPADQAHLIDADIPAQMLTPKLDMIIDLLEPTGVGNGPLVLRTRRLRIVEVSLFGRGSEHCKLLVDTGLYRWPALYWGAGATVAGKVSSGDLVDVVYRLEPDYEDGMRRLRMIVLDLHRS